MPSIEDRVVAIVSEQLEIDAAEITRDSPFATDLGADSLDQADMMIEFEKVFSLKFPPGSADKLQSIAQVIALIESTTAE